jgi:hypothetical protein
MVSLPLDVDGKFVLAAVDDGWELVVDGRRAHHCRGPREALQYMRDAQLAASGARELTTIVAELTRIARIMERATDTVVCQQAAVSLAPLFAHLDGDRRACVRTACFFLGGCESDDEFRLHPEREHVLARAKAILEPYFEARGL